MALEDRLISLLGGLVEGRAYPDVIPDVPVFPLLIYQQAGGRDGWYVENRLPSHRHARIQFHVWAKARQQANTLALLVEKTLAESGLIVEPYGAFTALYEKAQKLHGTRQDFGIWHNDSE